MEKRYECRKLTRYHPKEYLAVLPIGGNRWRISHRVLRTASKAIAYSHRFEAWCTARQGHSDQRPLTDEATA